MDQATAPLKSSAEFVRLPRARSTSFPSSSLRPRLWTFLIILLSLHVHATAQITVGPQLEIKPWNLGIVLSILVWSTLVFFGWRPRLSSASVLPLGLFFFFALWMGVAGFHSPQLAPAVAVVVAQIENVLLFGILASALTESRDREVLNRSIFMLGVFVAAVSLALYAEGLRRLVDPIASSEAVERTVGYVYDRGLALRLTGFAEDPNFFSLYMGISLLTGLSLPRGRWTWIGLALIGLSLFLAMSRTFVAVLVATSLVVYLLKPSRTRRGSPIKGYQRSLFLAILTIAALGMASIVLSPDIREFALARLTSVPDQSRFTLWAATVQNWDHPILGDGLRSIDWAVGNFSHNTYLDVVVETGLIGAFAWGSFVLAVSVLGFRRLKEPGVAPWFHAWLLLLGMAWTFSLVYNPIFVLVAAMLTGGPLIDRRDVPQA